MSSRSTPVRNSDETRRSLEQLRRGQQPTEGEPTAYEAEEGVAKPWPGDDDAPHVKVPPFTEEPQLWFPPTELTDTYQQTTSIDVEDYRLLQILFELRFGELDEDTTCQLGMIAEHLANSVLDPPEAWFVTGVVDPTVTYVTAAGFGDGFGRRSIAPSELVTRAFTATGVRTVRFALQFDVANSKAFRLNVSDLVQTPSSTLAMTYQRSN